MSYDNVFLLLILYSLLIDAHFTFAYFSDMIWYDTELKTGSISWLNHYKQS